MKFPFVTRPALTFLCGVGLVLVLASGLRAQTAPVDGQPLTPDQVDQLVGPIALYPDALVALILPASSTPGDIVLAQRYVDGGGDSDHIEDQLWNDSVKGLARYPQLLKWLDENLAWTQQLGSAFLTQQDEMMNSVQRLRARAKASGALTSTAQQKLVLDGDDIEIVPAQPNVIYVPYYDPNVVYGPPGYYNGPPYVTFGSGLPIGFWLSYDFNWRSRAIWVGDRQHNWSDHQGWSHHPAPGGSSAGHGWHQWKPPVTRPGYAPPPSNHRSGSDLPRPRQYPGAPPYPGSSSRDPRPGNPAPHPEVAGHVSNPNPNFNYSRSPEPPHLPGQPPRMESRESHPQRPQPSPGPVSQTRPVVNAPSPSPTRPTGPGSNRPPMPTQSSPNNRGPFPTQPTTSGAPMPTRPSSGQPMPRPVSPPPHQVMPQPQSPPPSKDSPRDQQPEKER